MKKHIKILLVLLLSLGFIQSVYTFNIGDIFPWSRQQQDLTFGAPLFRAEQSLIPIYDSQFFLGTTTPSTKAWLGVITDQLCLTGDVCRTTWPSSASAAFPFTVATNYGAAAVSTSTPVWFTAGIMASTTANYLAGLHIDGNASGDAPIKFGPTSNEWIMGYDATDKTFAIASSTTLGTTNALSITKGNVVTLGTLTTAATLTFPGTAPLITTGAGDPSLTISGVGGLTASSTTQVGIRGPSLWLYNYATAIYDFYNTAATYAGKLDFSNIASSDKTFTFPNLSGTVVLGTGTQGQLAYWTNTNTLTTVATSTVTPGNGLTYTGSGNVFSAVGGSSGQIGLTSGYQNIRIGFAFSTTTPGTGTTTYYLPPAPANITFSKAICEFNTFYGISLYDGSNRANYFVASSTIGQVALSVNNTFTTRESIRVDIGTSTAPTGRAVGSCGFYYSYD